MTNEERDALIERARKTPWLDAMKRRETEALLAALDEARGYAQQLTRRVERGNAIAQRREEELQRERDEARRMLDRMADESHVFNTILESTQRERDAARAQLAALREAAARYVHSLGEDEETHPTLGRVFVSRDDDGAEDALDEALADTAPAVEAYTRRVQAEALESAADAMRADTSLPFDTRDGRDWLRARAAELRGGR